MPAGKHISSNGRSSVQIERNHRTGKKSLKVPIQGICIVLLSIVWFLIWLGCMVIVAKLIFG